MKKVAVLVVQPRHIDYPIFRYNMHRFKHLFDSVWIAFSQHHQDDDYTNFVRADLPFAHFIDAYRVGSDWRDDAVNQALDQMKDVEHVLFLEQDFLMKDEHFLKTVFEAEDKFLYFTENDRIHPGFALVERALIEKTKKDFSAVAPYDHFKMFFDDLGPGRHIDTLGLRAREDYYHMNGLSQNYVNFQYEDALYRPINFLYFNYKSYKLPVAHHPKFHELERQILVLKGHPEHHSFLDKFFPNEL